MATKKVEIKELSIEEKLDQLVALQNLDSSIDEIRVLRGELPLEVQDLEDEIAGLTTRLENFQNDVEEKKETGLMKFREVSKLNVWGEVIQEAEYQGRKVELNNPTRGDVKKFKVYVKNDKGNVVKVEYGDPNMEIKRDDPARRKSFRARHNCDNPGPKYKARDWSCKFWEKGKTVTDLMKG